MIPYCRPPTALASFPGSGNTWLRFLIESATGVFTGSRYKDLQIQMYGKSHYQVHHYVCFSGHLHRRKVSVPFFRDLASRPRGVEKGTSLPPVLMVGMNK